MQPATTDHEHDERVILAAEWLANTPRHEIAGSVVATIRERFGLSPKEACAACTLASAVRAGR